MKLVRRPLAPGETDYELVWLVVSVAGALLLLLWNLIALPYPVCLFHLATGHPCPTCGATRAALSFSCGDFFGAWHWNPLATLSFVAIAVFDCYASVVLLARARRWRPVNVGGTEWRVLRYAFVAALMANWAYLWRHPFI